MLVSMSKCALCFLLLPLATYGATSGVINAQSDATFFSQTIYDKYKRVTTASASSASGKAYPHLTDSQGHWEFIAPDAWTSGFFPGTLYLLNARSARCPDSSSTNWLALARTWSHGALALDNGNNQRHDQGFLSFPFMEELKVNPSNSTAQSAVNKFAKLLAARFNPKVGCTESWDTPRPGFRVIMDNMMNLELLFVSAALTGNATYKTIAMSHADKTMINHLRSDSSSYHVVEYNADNGGVIRKFTAQGYADWSTWSRGQAWGIYGFAMMHHYTGQIRYLKTSRNMANLYLTRLLSSNNGVPPWDFDAPAPAPADTSSSAVAAAGLLLLSQTETNSTLATIWSNNAVKLLTNASNLGWKPNWDSILSNGTSNYPAGSASTGIVYGDYYFVKATNMLLDMGLADCSGIFAPAGPGHVMMVAKTYRQ